MIEFQEVSKVYPNGTRALDRVNLIIEKGEFAFIVGPSGAGKSTLLKLILREEKATEGEIFVNGFQLSKIRRWQVSRLRRSIGMVFQDFSPDSRTVGIRQRGLCPARDQHLAA